MGSSHVKLKTMHHIKSGFKTEPEFSKKSKRNQTLLKVKPLKRIICIHLNGN